MGRVVALHLRFDGYVGVVATLARARRTPMTRGLQPISPGVWRSQISDATGRRHSRTHHTRTKKEAERLHLLFLQQVRGGEITGDTHTVADLLDAWLEHRKQAIAESTWLDYRQLINRDIKPELGNLRLDKVTTITVDRYLAALPHGNMRKALGIFSQAFRQAVRWGWITRDPIANVTRPRKRKREETVPAPEQVDALIAAAHNDTFRLFLRLAAVTGARRGELTALQWSDIDLTKNTIVVQATMTRTANGPKRGKTTKTKTSRTVTIDDITAGWLARHQRSRHEALLAAGKGKMPHGYVFSDNLGHDPIGTTTITSHFAKARKAAGINPHTRLHDLRHFAVTQALAQGGNIPDLARRFGHNAATMLGTYGHAMPSGDAAIAQGLARLLKEA